MKQTSYTYIYIVTVLYIHEHEASYKYFLTENNGEGKPCAKAAIHSSPIAVLQERFRGLQRVKAMREEPERLRMLAERKHNKQLMMIDSASNPATMHYEPAREGCSSTTTTLIIIILSFLMMIIGHH